MRRLLEWARGIVSLHGSPRGIALGFAMGFSLSLFPVPVAGMILALALVPVVRANPAATYFGTAVVNPLTGSFWYFAELWVGAWIIDHPIPPWSELTRLDAWGWWDLFVGLLAPFGVGAATVMTAGFASSYAIVHAIVVRWRSKSAVVAAALPVAPGAADAHQDAQPDHQGEHV